MAGGLARSGANIDRDVIRAVLISLFFCDPINCLIFLDVDFLDSILSRAVVLGKVWWGPDPHHVKYIAWPSPYFSKYYRAR